MWHGLIPDDLLPAVVRGLPVRSWPSVRLVSHAMHASVDAIAVTPEGLHDVLRLINAGGQESTQLLVWIHAEDDGVTIQLARAHFGLGPQETGPSRVIPFARLTCRVFMDLMQYAAQSRDTRAVSHGGDTFEHNKKTVTTAKGVDELLLREVLKNNIVVVPDSTSSWGSRIVKVNPWTGKDIEGKWPGRGPVPDTELWDILRWVMRRMTPEYEFASFYFEFIRKERQPCAQISCLLWQRQH